MAITSFRDEHFYLSNMYQFKNAIATPDGETVHTSEQLYLSSRLLSHAARVVVQSAVNGFKAKKLANSLRAAGCPERPDWDNVKVQKMRASVAAKFVANPSLAQKLIDTGDQPLIEGNKRNDLYWGAALPIQNHNSLKGLNYLGRILMDTRQELQDGTLVPDGNPEPFVAQVFAPVVLYSDMPKPTGT